MSGDEWICKIDGGKRSRQRSAGCTIGGSRSSVATSWPANLMPLPATITHGFSILRDVACGIVAGHPLRLKSCRGISKSLRQHGCSRYPVSLHNADMADCARYNNLTRRLARTGYCSLNFADSFRRSTKVEVAPRSFRRSTLHAIIVRAVPSMGHHAGRCRADNAWKTTVLKIARQFDRKQHWAFERLLALRISSTGRDRGRPR